MKKEIVFGPSAQGSLRIAQFAGVGDYPQRFLCNIKGEDGEVSKEIEELNKENIRKWNNSRPIGGRADDIICLEYDLEYGDISESVPANKRYQSIQEMISTMYPKDRYGDTMLGDMQIFSRIKRLIVRGELVLEEEWQDSPMATMVRRK